MDGNTDERKTRSGRKISGAGSKRARDNEENNDVVPKKTKMDPQMEQLKAFFSKELETKLKSNRAEIVADNRESLKSLTERIDVTQSELQNHKNMMQEELKKVHEKLNSVVPEGSCPSLTYAAAAGCYSGEATSVATLGWEATMNCWEATGDLDAAPESPVLPAPATKRSGPGFKSSSTPRCVFLEQK